MVDPGTSSSSNIFVEKKLSKLVPHPVFNSLATNNYHILRLDPIIISFASNCESSIHPNNVASLSSSNILSIPLGTILEPSCVPSLVPGIYLSSSTHVCPSDGSSSKSSHGFNSSSSPNLSIDSSDPSLVTITIFGWVIFHSKPILILHIGSFPSSVPSCYPGMHLTHVLDISYLDQSYDLVHDQRVSLTPCVDPVSESNLDLCINQILFCMFIQSSFQVLTQFMVQVAFQLQF